MSEVKMTVPEEVLSSIMKAQVVAALGKSEHLIKAVIDSAMTQKRNSYDRNTIWEEQMMEAIRSAVKDTWEEWLKEQKPAIKKALIARLKADNSKAIAQIVDNLVGGYAIVNPKVILEVADR